MSIFYIIVRRIRGNFPKIAILNKKEAYPLTLELRFKYINIFKKIVG